LTGGLIGMLVGVLGGPVGMLLGLGTGGLIGGLYDIDDATCKTKRWRKSVATNRRGATHFWPRSTNSPKASSTMQ
jgi:uncharacterized membrane protein